MEEEDLNIEEDYDIKENDEYIETLCAINWDSPPIYDDYLEDFSQGDKIELEKNKVIYIQGEPITHTIDETFNIKKQKVIDFTDYNHRLVQSVCSVVDEFSIDEQSSNLLKLELEHIRHYDFIGVDQLLSKFFGNIVNINLERLMDNVIDPFWEDFIEQELIEVNKRRKRVILSNLCGGGNMKFLDMYMDSFLVLASYIPPWQKRSRIKIRISRFIMSEKRLISSILIRLVLHRRIGWRGLFGVPIERGRLPQNSRTSFPQPQENDAD